jgi:hypothetical protein
LKRALNVLHFLTLPVIAIGGLYLVMQVVILYLTWSRRDPGMDIADAASAASSSIKGVAIGIAIMLATFIARAIINARLRKEE